MRTPPARRWHRRRLASAALAGTLVLSACADSTPAPTELAIEPDSAAADAAAPATEDTSPDTAETEPATEAEPAEDAAPDTADAEAAEPPDVPAGDAGADAAEADADAQAEAPTAAPAATATPPPPPPAPVDDATAQAAAEANLPLLQAASNVNDFEVLDVADGSIATLRQAVTGDRPVLLWFFSPH